MGEDINNLKQDLTRRMQGALEAFRHNLSGLRSGRASPALLEPIRVEAYGSLSPLTQVASISVPEPRMLAVQVWDKSMVSAVDKAIRESGLGLNPIPDGQLVRVPIPQLTEERRLELVKAAGRYAEDAKVAIRGVRRDGMDHAKNAEKNGDIGKDEVKNWSDEIQKLTDEFVKKVDDILSEKERDIKQV